MNSHSHFSEKFFNEIDESHLENFTEKYPWCAVAQLSLLSSYKKNSSPNFEKQGSKAGLFFNNNSWLNWQLHLISEEVEVKQEEIPDRPVEEEMQNERIQESLADISSQANTTEAVIAFEPLHTTDYFASQGIKLTDEPVSNDKLGSQVKSFTEWLKSMKKIHKENLPAGDEQTDKNIQQIAEGSNADAEVVTEAMADVLVKQDKRDKAIEVYQKLSLINPSKSAYFAAKIDTLKAS
jgi:hypothetical protein